MRINKGTNGKLSDGVKAKSKLTKKKKKKMLTNNEQK